MITALFSIIAGLLLLFKGADWLVTGASSWPVDCEYDRL